LSILNCCFKWKKFSDREAYYTNLAKEAIQAHKTNNMKETYKVVNIIAGNFKKYNTINVKNNNIDSSNYSKNIIEEWKKYCINFLNNQSTLVIDIKDKSDELPINTDNFTMNEINQAWKYKSG
jgi:hypothetical protein